DWFLSFGGEVRERFENYSAANFGVPGKEADGYLLQRVLVHADLHAGNYVRSFVQLGSHLALGKDAAAPPYSDRLDVQQAFLDLRFPVTKGPEADPILRIGRQEMAFGSQRLVSIRDAPNVRRAFDGVRLGGLAGKTRYDVFATRPVLLREDTFDDKPNYAQEFWGAYATAPSSFIPNSGFDLYYLGFENDRALFSVGTGIERRHSIGARVFGHNKEWDWDWEALGQFGTFSQQNIRAWGFSTDTGYTFLEKAGRPRAGIKFTVGSGDRNPNDSTLSTYGPLFPKLAYFNQAGLVGASNVIDLQPSLTFKPTSSIKITVACDFIWRQTTGDAVYTSLATPIVGTAGRPGRYSGSEPSIDLTWQANRHTFINTGLVYVNTAKVLDEVGGHNTNFIYISAAYTF
ncbi:MAG: alginate export family protein, partial [Bryobacteraceae bacterium]